MKEYTLRPASGILWLLIWLAITSLGIWLIALEWLVTGITLSVIGFFMFFGLAVVNPNEALVLNLFGKYKGTIRDNGFFWMNPLILRKRVSLRARNMDSPAIKVNDKLGNPIMISIVLVWRVEETFKAIFEVDQYELFVKVQSEAAIRHLAGMYPYDSFDEQHQEMSLRSGGEEINHELERELTQRLAIAGIQVIEARISNLAYASEIASAMLQRQQATAIIAARQKIVEGAVTMVEMALHQLSEKQIVALDEEKKAAMVSNLLVVLCSDKSAQPVLNAGTLNH